MCSILVVWLLHALVRHCTDDRAIVAMRVGSLVQALLILLQYGQLARFWQLFPDHIGVYEFALLQTAFLIFSAGLPAIVFSFVFLLWLDSLRPTPLESA